MYVTIISQSNPNIKIFLVLNYIIKIFLLKSEIKVVFWE